MRFKRSDGKERKENKGRIKKKGGGGISMHQISRHQVEFEYIEGLKSGIPEKMFQPSGLGVNK